MTDLSIECCDPRDRAEEIIELFARDGLPEFRDVFERAYRPRAETGLRSWVGTRDGGLAMHVSVSPQPFGRSGQEMKVGIMGDLMVEESIRDFWRPLRLLRRVKADLQERGDLQMLMTTTTAEAQGVFKAGGFKPVAHLRRFVFPLAAPVRVLSHIASATLPTRTTAVRLDDAAAGPQLETAASGGAWRPRPCLDFYTTRIPREGYADGTWVGAGGSHGCPSDGWTLMSRHPERSEYAVADCVWADHGRGFARTLLAAASWARSQGARVMSVVTLDESHVSKRLRRLGFVGRRDRMPFLVQSLGEGSAPPPEDWFLTGLITSAW